MEGRIGNEAHQYAAVRRFNPSELDEIIASDDIESLRLAPISVSMYEGDFELAHDVCAKLTAHPDSTVRGNAVLGFGHLARRFRTLHLATVEPIYRLALKSKDDYVRMQANDMLDDIRYYLNLGESWPDTERTPV
jgi:hypothetical protein